MDMYQLNYTNFKPLHFDGCRSDFEGNGTIGRYVLLPGSPGRAEKIAKEYLSHLEVKESSRGHTLYLGDIKDQDRIIKAAVIATGMGGPSIDIILSELIFLGAKRFLRIGTAGALQNHITIGDIVVATAAVRDESTSSNYIPVSFPATASTDVIIHADALRQTVDYNVHLGIIHSKDSLYAREFFCGPFRDEHIKFTEQLKAYGVVASEMECAQLYILAQLYSQTFGYEIKSGCILGIIGDGTPFSDSKNARDAIRNATDFGIKLIKQLAAKELSQ